MVFFLAFSETNACATAIQRIPLKTETIAPRDWLVKRKNSLSRGDEGRSFSYHLSPQMMTNPIILVHPFSLSSTCGVDVSYLSVLRYKVEARLSPTYRHCMTTTDSLLALAVPRLYSRLKAPLGAFLFKIFYPI
jgi:hypothetical protein